MSSMLPPSEPSRWPGGPGPSTPRAPDPEPVVAETPAPAAGPVVVETTGQQGNRGLVYGLVGGGVAAAVALGAAGVWAWAALGGGGDRPADALPGSTFVYAAVDLDPAAGQKIEAFKTLNKFPAFKEAGVEDNGDLSGSFWDKLFEGDKCKNFDAATDVTPWLGKRAAFAGVSLDGDVVPVGVVQVTDEKAAPAGLHALAACEAKKDATATTGVTDRWVVRDGWAYIAKDTKTATRVADAAGSGTTLADSSDYKGWTDRLGDQGIVTVWAAPKPGQKATALMKQLDGSSTFPADGLEAVNAQFDTFQGGAATLRFADGGLELASAMGLDPDQAKSVGPGLGTSVTSLPDDTLAAVGISAGPGYVNQTAENLSRQSGGQVDAQQMFDGIEQQTGLKLPKDLQTLLGRSFVLSLGGGFDPKVLSGSSDPLQAPVAAKITGDQKAVEGVVTKLSALDPGMEQILGTTPSGKDVLVVGPNAAYRKSVATGGKLGDSDRFSKVVPHADDSIVTMYLDLDGKNDWLVKTVGEEDPEAKANLAPLSAIGMSAWVEDGDVVRMTMRAATD